MLLLRLRQLCSHPSLIQEGGTAFVGADEATDGPHDKHSELTRAAQLVSMEFVEKMKHKFKQIVLERMAAEKEVRETSTYLCTMLPTYLLVRRCHCRRRGMSHLLRHLHRPYRHLLHTRLLQRMHQYGPSITLHGGFLMTAPTANVLNAAPRQDANEPNQYKADERPCPTCRGAISHKTIFSRRAFEPTDAELAAATGRAVKVEDEDVIMISDSEDKDDLRGKGKGRAKPAPGRALRVKRRLSYAESEDEEDEDDSMSDFIVEDDDDDWEERRDARREEKRAARRMSKGKGRAAARRVVMSDSEDEGVILGAKPTIPQDIPKEQIALLPRFLPSTKMKVSFIVFCSERAVC